MIKNEKELIDDLNCDELCALNDKEDLKILIAQKIIEKNCRCCYC